MPKLVTISGKKMIKLLNHCSFKVIRIKGSHHFLRNNETNLVTTVPVHGNEDLGVSMIKDILSDVNMSIEQYEKLRRKV